MGAPHPPPFSLLPSHCSLPSSCMPFERGERLWQASPTLTPPLLSPSQQQQQQPSAMATKQLPPAAAAAKAISQPASPFRIVVPPPTPPRAATPAPASFDDLFLAALRKHVAAYMRTLRPPDAAPSIGQPPQ